MSASAADPDEDTSIMVLYDRNRQRERWERRRELQAKIVDVERKLDAVDAEIYGGTGEVKIPDAYWEEKTLSKIKFKHAKTRPFRNEPNGFEFYNRERDYGRTAIHSPAKFVERFLTRDQWERLKAKYSTRGGYRLSQPVLTRAFWHVWELLPDELRTVFLRRDQLFARWHLGRESLASADKVEGDRLLVIRPIIVPQTLRRFPLIGMELFATLYNYDPGTYMSDGNTPPHWEVVPDQAFVVIQRVSADLRFCSVRITRLDVFPLGSSLTATDLELKFEPMKINWQGMVDVVSGQRAADPFAVGGMSMVMAGLPAARTARIKVEVHATPLWTRVQAADRTGLGLVHKASLAVPAIAGSVVELIPSIQRLADLPRRLDTRDYLADPRQFDKEFSA